MGLHVHLYYWLNKPTYSMLASDFIPTPSCQVISQGSHTANHLLSLLFSVVIHICWHWGQGTLLVRYLRWKNKNKAPLTNKNANTPDKKTILALLDAIQPTIVSTNRKNPLTAMRSNRFLNAINCLTFIKYSKIITNNLRLFLRLTGSCTYY